MEMKFWDQCSGYRVAVIAPWVNSKALKLKPDMHIFGVTKYSHLTWSGPLQSVKPR